MSGKLVRDRIIEIMSEQGISTVSRRLTGQEYLTALRAKLDEEIAEFDAAVDRSGLIDELADIIEVAYALGDARGINRVEIVEHRLEKKHARGGFREGIWLDGPSTKGHAFVSGFDIEDGRVHDECQHREGRHFVCGAPKAAH